MDLKCLTDTLTYRRNFLPSHKKEIFAYVQTRSLSIVVDFEAKRLRKLQKRQYNCRRGMINSCILKSENGTAKLYWLVSWYIDNIMDENWG